MAGELREIAPVEAGGIGNLAAHLPDGEPRYVLAVVAWLAVTYVLYRWSKRF